MESTREILLRPTMTAKAAIDAPRAGRGGEGVLEDRDPGASRSARLTAEPDETGDHELVEDFLGGDSAAAGTVALWVRQAAGRYRGRLPTEWDDLLQDLLLEVTVALREGSFRGDSSLRTYVWRIAHYRCLNRIRDLARRPESELGAGMRSLPDPARPVLDRLVERESEDLLLRFLDTVSADCRRLWRSILAGRSYREISDETGVSEGTLRVRILRCRRKALVLWRSWLEQTNG